MQNISLTTQGISFTKLPELLMDVNDHTRVLLFAAQDSTVHTSQPDRVVKEIGDVDKTKHTAGRRISLLRLFKIFAHPILLLDRSMFFKSDQMCHGDLPWRSCLQILLNIMSKATTC